MARKDMVTLGVSIVALIVSVVTTVRGELKTKAEYKRIQGARLLDVLTRMTELGMSNVKLQQDRKDDNDLFYFAASSVLNMQNSLLLDEAQFLSAELSDLITPSELQAIAVGYENLGNLAMAESFFIRAVERSTESYSRVVNLRAYAAFLFIVQRFEEGREQYRKALKVYPSADNIGHFMNGLTFQYWGGLEKNFAYSGEAKTCFDNAEKEYLAISSEQQRTMAMKTLSAIRNAGAQPAANPDNAIPSVNR